MNFVLLTLGFLLIAVATWMFLATLATPNQTILFSREFARTFRTRYTGRLGTAVQVANLFGTLTSLATVYIFFIGTSKVFGGYIFAAPLTIFAGYLATNYLTKKILEERPRYRQDLAESDTVTGVVAKIVRTSSPQGRSLAAIVKWVSLLSIAGFIWLELAIFSDIARDLVELGEHSITAGAICFFVVAFLIIYLILKYGVRGFVFADLLQGPIILLGSIIILGAMIFVAVSADFGAGEVRPFQPLAPMGTVWLFIAHVFLLNMSFVLVTEGHWFRLWLFGSKEIEGQRTALLTTSVTWAILALVGCLAVVVTQEVGNPGVTALLAHLFELSPILVMIFWITASSALFSTADAQIFHFLLLKNFDAKTGTLTSGIQRPLAPLKQAFVAALAMAAIYYATRYANLPFEKLVFSITPLCSNLLPGLVAVAFRYEAPLKWTCASIAGYAAFCAIGFVQPADELAWTLAAALVPVACTIGMLATVPRTRPGDLSA